MRHISKWLAQLALYFGYTSFRAGISRDSEISENMFKLTVLLLGYYYYLWKINVPYFCHFKSYFWKKYVLHYHQNLKKLIVWFFQSIHQFIHSNLFLFLKGSKAHSACCSINRLRYIIFVRVKYHLLNKKIAISALCVVLSAAAAGYCIYVLEEMGCCLRIVKLCRIA